MLTGAISGSSAPPHSHGLKFIVKEHLYPDKPVKALGGLLFTPQTQKSVVLTEQRRRGGSKKMIPRSLAERMSSRKALSCIVAFYNMRHYKGVPKKRQVSVDQKIARLVKEVSTERPTYGTRRRAAAVIKTEKSVTLSRKR